MGNDPVRTRLFISTLKRVAFEWFHKLPKGFITCWDDLEVLFLSRFFKEEVDINMHTLLLIKQKKMRVHQRLHRAVPRTHYEKQEWCDPRDSCRDVSAQFLNSNP